MNNNFFYILLIPLFIACYMGARTLCENRDCMNPQHDERLEEIKQQTEELKQYWRELSAKKKLFRGDDYDGFDQKVLNGTLTCADLCEDAKNNARQSDATSKIIRLEREGEHLLHIRGYRTYFINGLGLFVCFGLIVFGIVNGAQKEYIEN